MNNIGLAALMFTCIVEMVLCLILFDAAMRRKYRQNYFYILAYLGLAILIFMFNLLGNAYINIAATVMLPAIVGKLLYRDNMVTCCAASIVQLVCSICAEGLAVSLNSVLYYDNTYLPLTLFELSYPHISQMLVCKIFQTVIVLILARMLHGRRGMRCSGSQLVLFFAHPVITCLIAPIVFRFSYMMPDLPKWILLLLVAISCLLILVEYLLFQNALNSAALARELQMVRQQADMQSRYYEGLQNSYHDTRSIIHDIKNHLAAIDAMCVSGSSLLPEYTGDLRQQLEQSHYIVAIEVRNEMFNIVMTDKQHICQQNGIILELCCMVDDLSFLSSADTCVIMANSMDNAIDACAQVVGEKTISVQLYKHNKMLIITVTNPIAQPVRQRDGCIITTKQDKTYHGFGLSNIRRAVERYRGNLNIQFDDRTFCLVISFPMRGE